LAGVRRNEMKRHDGSREVTREEEKEKEGEREEEREAM
jgi:hypothetical protein